MTKPLFITHASMRRADRPEHIAFCEIDSFARIINARTSRDACVIDVSDARAVNEGLNEPFDIVVFATLSSDPDVKALALRADKLFVVLPDPNWELDVDFGRSDYTLVTPFQALEQSVDPVSTLVDTIHANIPGSPDHVFLPFGEMALHDRKYLSLFMASRSVDHLMPTLQPEYVYAGSLKPNRAQIMADMAATGELSVFGNFTAEDLDSWRTKDVGRKETIEDNTMGYVPAMSVWRLYSDYDSALMISDPQMTALRTHYMRPLEYALAGAKVEIRGTDPAAVAADESYYGAYVIDDSTGRASISKIKSCYTFGFVDRLRALVD